MFVIVAHLTIHPGQEAAYRTYEEQALALFRVHGGEVVAAFRPQPHADGKPMPHEIHVLRIDAEDAFAAFRADPGLVALTALRTQAIAETEIFMSQEMVLYGEGWGGNQ